MVPNLTLLADHFKPIVVHALTSTTGFVGFSSAHTLRNGIPVLCAHGKSSHFNSYLANQRIRFATTAKIQHAERCSGSRFITEDFLLLC